MTEKINGKKFLSDLKLYSDYLKWNKELKRYENWQEACFDIIMGHKQKFINHPNMHEIYSYLDDAYEGMVVQDILASQRSLQYRFTQIKAHNTRLYNCTVGFVCDNTIFQKIFYLLLSGCGFGGGLLIPFVKNLSNIQKRSDETVSYIIQDSIEGWSDAFGVLLSSYFVDNQPFPEYFGKRIRFEYSLIREEGALISGGFKAPGPEPLRNSLEMIEGWIDKWLNEQGGEIRPILAMDIICMASNAVLSGGVRRAALDMILDPNDKESVNAKIGNWREKYPWRERSNNSVLLIEGYYDKDYFEYLVQMNDGMSDIGFVFGKSWLDMYNPCFEISFTPILVENTDLTSIKYEDVYKFIRKYKHLTGIMGCNLSEINGEKPKTLEEFLTQCRRATIMGTIQATYTDFPYLGEISKRLFEREALLGVSITGITNNPKLINPEWLRAGAEECKRVNKELALLLGINQSARITCIKPSGNASVVLGVPSGIHPEHAEKYFRIMQLNKNNETAKYLNEHQPFLLEEGSNPNGTDWVVYIPIINPSDGLFKDDLKGVKHLELIKLVQQYWVLPGTNPELGISPKINHNVSATVIVDNQKDIIDYIWDNKEFFTAISFLSDFGDREYNQAPFTTVNSFEKIISKYGKGALFASGLIVDGLHYFNNNLWVACKSVEDKSIPLVGTREQVLLKQYWIKRAKKFARNYFKGDTKQMIYCLKDVHLYHKWETILRDFKNVNFETILTEPSFKNINSFSAAACSGGACEITHI